MLHSVLAILTWFATAPGAFSSEVEGLHRGYARDLRGRRRAAGPIDRNCRPRQALVHRRDAGRHCGRLPDDKLRQKNNAVGLVLDRGERQSWRRARSGRPSRYSAPIRTLIDLRH